MPPPHSPSTTSCLPSSGGFFLLIVGSQALVHERPSISGKVTWQVPESIPSIRANPLPSNVPSATISPSGRVILYFSPGTGFFSASTNSISIQLFFFSFSPGVCDRLYGFTGVEPYLPDLVCSCSALIFSTSPGSALSASREAAGSAGETAEPAFPVLGE